MKNELFIFRYLYINFAITLNSPVWEYTYIILIKVLKVKHGIEISLQISARCDIGWHETVNLHLKFSNNMCMYFTILIHFVLGALILCCPSTGVMGSWCMSVLLGLKNWLHTSTRQAKKPHCKAPKTSVYKFSNTSWETPVKFGFSWSASSTLGSFLVFLFIYFFVIHLSSPIERSVAKITGAECRSNCTSYNRSKWFLFSLFGSIIC